MFSDNARAAARKTFNSIKVSVPILVAVLLLISLAIAAIPESAYAAIFTGNAVVDPFMGAIIGSVAAGNPINSYIVGGELIQHSVSIIAVAAFIVAWVTVGIVQLPAESMLLGKKFALIRNGTAFLLAIAVAIITSLTWGLL